jgi:hypothetical protein
MNKNTYNISADGISISFLAGGCICAGLSLLHLHYNATIKNKDHDPDYTVDYLLIHHRYITKMTSLAFLGGATTSVGLYFLVPNKIRSLWF